jgi:uncharacterized protein YciI
MICARIAWSAADKTAERAAYIEDHKRFLRSGKLDVLQSGPVFDEGGNQQGALVVAEVADIATMRRICAEDPFDIHGIYDRVTFLEWRITAGRSF